MNRQAVIDHRKERLQALVDQKFEGSKAALGRALGYRDGAFVGQMLRGERPISEKTVEQIHGLQAGKDWFSVDQSVPRATEPEPTYQAITTAQAIRALGQALLTMEPELRDQAATLLQSMARNPEGPWAEWLIDMVEKRENPMKLKKRQF